MTSSKPNGFRYKKPRYAPPLFRWGLLLPDGIAARRQKAHEYRTDRASGREEDTLNSFPTLNTKTKMAASSRNIRTAGPRKQVWQFRHDENRRRWNKLPNGYRNALLATS